MPHCACISRQCRLPRPRITHRYTCLSFSTSGIHALGVYSHILNRKHRHPDSIIIIKGLDNLLHDLTAMLLYEQLSILHALYSVHNVTRLHPSLTSFDYHIVLVGDVHVSGIVDFPMEILILSSFGVIGSAFDWLDVGTVSDGG